MTARLHVCDNKTTMWTLAVIRKMKLQKAVVDETRRIAIGSAIGTLIMLAVFAAIGRFDSTVVLGALLGYVTAVLNFFLMSVTVQQAAGDIQGDEEERVSRGKRLMRTSYSMRRLLQGVVIVVALLVPCFNWVATVIPLVLPQLSIVARQLFSRHKSSERTDKPNG